MTGNPELYTYVNNKRLRRGHTTGTCAAAASKAAAEAVLSGRPVDRVTIATPRGITLELPVEDLSFDSTHARCAVRKDGGDDIDATHGTLVYSDVTLTESGIDIDGGKGVGRVTRRKVWMRLAPRSMEASSRVSPSPLMRPLMVTTA